jgi:biopolymer transport protein ExbD
MPSIRLRCPHCQHSSSVHERLLGREIKCPRCQGPLQVPARDRLDQLRQDKAEEKQLETTLSKYLSKRESVDPFASAHDPHHPSADSIVVSFDEDQAVHMPPRVLPKDDMDMTPMVDVTFLLLIFFMITANFTQQKAIQVPAQRSNEASTNVIQDPQKIDDLVIVQIDEFNGFTIVSPDGSERQSLSKQDLIVSLGEIRSENADVVRLQVQAHQDCIHAAVINALDAGREKGFSSLQVTLVEQFD